MEVNATNITFYFVCAECKVDSRVGVNIISIIDNGPPKCPVCANELELMRNCVM